jgi:peptide/nickel transport system substrate-binding protein
MAPALTVPSPAPAQSAPKRGGVLKISVSTRTTSLNPLQISGPSEYIAIDMLYSGLLRMGVDMKPAPDLALSFTGDEDAKVFTFKLRPGVTFHDGSPFTADDVVATYRTILDPKSTSPARAALGSLRDITAVDPLTVRFTCANSFADFPVATAHWNARIVATGSLHDLVVLNTKANGTGPFKQDVFDSERAAASCAEPEVLCAGSALCRCGGASSVPRSDGRGAELTVRCHRCHLGCATGRLQAGLVGTWCSRAAGQIRPLR